MDSLVAEETAVLPGMEELSSLMQITALAESGQYDVIIIDAAPTGSTLQLLGFPDIARWYIEKIFPFQRKTLQLARPMVKRMTDMPLPDDKIFDSIEELVGYLERMSRLLGDATQSSMRVVLNPEKMVIKEAQRAYTYLNLYGYSVDAVICNRVFPRSLADHYFDTWKSAQSQNLELVHQAFHPLPEVVFGSATTRGGQGDPTQHYYIGKPQEIYRVGSQYVLSLSLPLVERSDIQMHRSVFDELVIRIGNWKRNVALPTGLAKLEVAGAKYVEDRLNILFDIPESTPEIPEEELKPRRWEALTARFRRNG
jgi:arsenite-transporting ATPase